MNAEIISVGAELISGDVSNTNASYLSQRLARLGISVTRQTAVDDTPESITEALAAAVARSPVILFTGGLGPTADDMTKEVVCNAVGMPLTENADCLSRLQAYFEAKGVEWTENNRKQAMFPQDAVIFPNLTGTADGCAIESGNQCIIMLPGPPKELEAMFESSVEDYLMGKTDSIIAARTVKVFGMGESKIAEKISHLLEGKDPTVATYLGNGDVRIKITATGENREACEQKCAQAEEEIVSLLGSCVYARENVSLEQTVVALLQRQGKKIATAESCTAGMLSETLTKVSGASDVFEFGVSAYANRIKQEVLSVPKATLQKYGAVSPQVAEAMAKGAAAKGGADLGIGITGIAGPSGGTAEKPVGLVYVSLFDGTRCFTRKLNCGADSSREKIRLSAVMNALDMTRLYLVKDPAFLNSQPAPAPAKKKAKWWHSFIPLKGDSRAQKIRKASMIFFLLVFLGAAGYLIDYFGQIVATRQMLNHLGGIFHSEASINERFEELMAINPDIVGWLTVPGTQCDNPVVKTDNNDTYLHTTFEGDNSKYGTLFADAGCRIEKPSSAETGAVEGLSDNIVIYGHHMRDGAMFGELKRYLEFAFYQEHPVLQFTTLYDTDTVDWKIVSIYYVNTTRYDAEDTIFNYRVFDFGSEHSFLRFVDECRQRSIFNTGVDVEYGDKLVSLSTCMYEFDDARLIVLARRVREGESNQVDLSQTSINTNAVYPKAYGRGKRTTVSSYVYPGTTSSKPAASTSSSRVDSSAPSTASSQFYGSSSYAPAPSEPYSNMWDGNYEPENSEEPPSDPSLPDESAIDESSADDSSSQVPETDQPTDPDRSDSGETPFESEESQPAQLTISEPESPGGDEPVTNEPTPQE